MGREHLKTAEDDVVEELYRVTRLFERALPDAGSRAVFEHLMNEASQRGMNWVDALEYVIQQRSPLCVQSLSQAAELAVA